MRLAISVLKETLYEWWDDGATRLAAALSYYTAFAIAPLLVLVLAVTGALFGEEAVRGQLEREISGLVGPQAASLIEGMVAKAGNEDSAGWASVLGVLALLIGATGVFAELQNALNTVWDVEPKPGRGLAGFLQTRVLSFAMVLGIGFLLLVSLVLSAALAFLTSSIGRYLFDGEAALASVFSFLGSFLTVTLLFAMIYKVLPDVRIDWRDVWVGAAATSFLFSVGKWLIGLYLGKSAIASTYGAAAALAILLVWVYYSAQIVLLGAEFTQVYARRFGKRILPDSRARAVETSAAPAR
jgi:membrane protein